MKTFRALVLCLSMIFPVTVVAATASSPSMTVDPASIPVLASILKRGAKIYSIGSRPGLDGWFITKDNKVQVAYTTPDGQSFIVGAVFDMEGQNVTVEQIKAAVSSNRDLMALMMQPGNPQQSPSASNDNLLPGTGTGKPASAPAEVKPPVPASTAAPVAELSPGEKLMEDLQKQASGINIGNPQAPLLFMIMDPDCPHCQATWKALHANIVDKKNLQIRMIPIGRDEAGEQRAAKLFEISDLVGAWDKYIAGDKSQLAGTPDPKFLAVVRANHVLIDSWKIKETPYLAYRAKDGTVKVLQGEPQKISAVLNDLIP